MELQPTRRRRVSTVAMAAALTMAAVWPVAAPLARGQEGAPLPNTFSLRLEGYAVEANTFSTASAVTPRSAYSFAKLNSVLDLDGGRGLDMEARGANDQYAGLEGAVLFSGDSPTDGNNLPGYAQAFFPTFEGFSEVAEKCAFNETEAKETPECRDQPGPYALALVVPDQEQPSVQGIGRNGGGEEQGDARSRSVIEPQPDGSVLGRQVNRGSNQAVPGTPITVDSYVAEQTLVASLGSTETDIRCTGEVSVNGQPVNDNRQLQQALAPLAVASDLRVEFEPPSEPEIVELAGGALQASCRGPRFTVFSGAQGGTGTSYTFGFTFAASGVMENADFSFGAGAGGGAVGGGGPIGPATSVGSVDDGASDTVTTTPTEVVEEPPAGSGSDDPPAEEPVEEASGPELVRRGVDALPIGAWTGLAAALLPLGVWLLLGVTGSLARGLPSLRLPPFPD